MLHLRPHRHCRRCAHGEQCREGDGGRRATPGQSALELPGQDRLHGQHRLCERGEHRQDHDASYDSIDAVVGTVERRAARAHDVHASEDRG